MTRKRMGTGLLEAFSEPCPHCGGRGVILHDAPIDLTPGEDAPAERRSGKNRRTRGRDAEPTEDVVTRVQHALGRKPDPRGPKPPPALVGGDVDSDIDGDDLEVVPRDHSRRTDDSGIEDAGSEALDTPGGSGADGDVLEPGLMTLNAAQDAEITDSRENAETADNAAGPEFEVVESAPVEARAPEQLRQPRRSRRAAGRPAGAPTGATEAVDIIVRPVSPDSATESGDTGGDAVKQAVNDAVNETVNGGSDPHGNGDDGSEPAAPAAPVRRRAARRPAGPASAPIPVDRVDEGGQADQQAEHQDQPDHADESVPVV